MKKEYSAGAVIYCLDKAKRKIEYLALHYGAGHWGFCKGKLDPGENNQEAALREIKEETGLDVNLDSNFEHRLYYKFRSREGELVSKEVTFFTAQTSVKKITLSFEHSDYEWLPYEEARQKLTHDNSVHLLDIAHAFVVRLHNV